MSGEDTEVALHKAGDVHESMKETSIVFDETDECERLETVSPSDDIVNLAESKCTSLTTDNDVIHMESFPAPSTSIALDTLTSSQSPHFSTSQSISSPPLGSSTPLEELPPDPGRLSSQTLSTVPSAVFSSNLSPCQPTGLFWSPCGGHLAVSTDTSLQVYSSHQGEFTPSARIKHAECLYSWLWSRGPCSTSPSLLVTTGRYQPVQLYSCQTVDNYPLTIQLESTYKCINQLDELSHAFSVALDTEATTLYCGIKGEVRVFDVNRPGRFSTVHLTKSGQRGIISCLAVSEVLPVYAAGCYDKTVGLYSTQGDRLCVLRGQVGGVTQLTFTKDGTKLFAGGRKDNELLCWDLRQPGMVLYTMQREVTTNQTIQFCLSPCEKYLSSAATDGSVRLWDLDKQADSVTGVLEPLAGWLLHRDASNGVGWHPGGELLATCSGQRHFKTPQDDMEIMEDENIEENSLVVWNLNS